MAALELRDDLFDDFCLTPLRPAELRARIEHLFSRAGRGTRPELVEYGPLALNLETYQAAQAADRVGPLERVDVVLDAEHGGGVDGGAFEDPTVELALLGQPEDLGQRAVGRAEALEPRHRTWAEDEHTVRPLAPEHLLPRVRRDVALLPGNVHRECRRGGVAQRQPWRGAHAGGQRPSAGVARASRVGTLTGAVVGDPVAVGDADARGGAVPSEADVVVLRHSANRLECLSAAGVAGCGWAHRVGLREVGQLAVVRGELAHPVPHTAA